ncbi:MAG TPA: ATP-binding protein, partial [Noviherbaspirillum sp.]|nr:ATP-binding protein [Noviherbaspirillum sp.]
ELDLPMNPRTRARRGAARIAALMVAVAIVAGVYATAEHRMRQDIHAAGARQLQIIALDLESLLERFESLPAAIAFHPNLARLLADPRNAQLAGQLNQTLQSIQQLSKVSAIYLMDAEGNTLVSSNWDTAQTFVGRNFAFRPYFRDAIEGRAGHFYGIGSVTSQPAYFIAQPVYPDGARAPLAKPAGVIAVRISLTEFEQSWRSSEDPIALADRIGVVFLSNRPEWRYHSMRQIDEGDRRYLAGTLQYVGKSILPISALPKEQQAGFGGHVSQQVGRLGWQLMLFPSQQRAARGAGYAALAAALLLSLVALGWWANHQRARRLEEGRASRRALQQAAEELDRKIAQRTEELLQANRHLEARYATLQQTEQMLRTAQNELVQAGKLAMLGQMAAGVTHELNQPLAAIRAFADNAVTFLQRGRTDAASDNLSQISAAAARMGAIIAQLKGFARKSRDTVATVDLASIIHASAALLDSEFRRHQAALAIEIDEALPVTGDAVRMEQVLINLLRNALDAVENGAERNVALHARRDEAYAVVTIRDSGPGITEEVRQHLFEPFFTTKPSGKGLGLGLAISSSIVQAMNGKLSARNHPQGGAEFELDLPLAPGDPCTAGAEEGKRVANI